MLLPLAFLNGRADRDYTFHSALQNYSHEFPKHLPSPVKSTLIPIWTAAAGVNFATEGASLDKRM